MEFITAILNYLAGTFGPALWVIGPIAGFIGIVAQMRLYAKADQPALAAIVPFWNFTTFMKVIGRPTWHVAYMILPMAAMLGALMADYKDMIAFSQGSASFADVALSLSVFMAAAIGFAVFMVRAHIDLCNSFGRKTVFDYVLVVLLNVLYVLNLGLSYEIEYEGPAYGRENGLASGSSAFA